MGAKVQIKIEIITSFGSFYFVISPNPLIINQGIPPVEQPIGTGSLGRAVLGWQPTILSF